MNALALFILPIATTLAAGASAQHPMGFSAGWDEGPSGTSVAHSPQSMSFSEGDFLTRIDHDDYRNWGLDPVVAPEYSTTCIVGFEFVLEDPDLATAENPAFITGWSEDPGNPNFPDVSGYTPFDGGSNFLFAGPVPANSAEATLFTFTLPDPGVCVATGQDIFLGLSIGPAATGEGLLVHGVNDAAMPALGARFDNPGPAGANIAAGSYVCVVPTTNQEPNGSPAVYTGYLAQNRIEVYVTNASGGVCTTVTNQPAYGVSHPTNGFGTPNFLSGLHPDLSSKPVNPGRNLGPPAAWIGDQLGFVYTDSRLEAGDAVGLFVAFQPALAPLRLDLIPGPGPGSTGQVLVDLATYQVISVGIAKTVADPPLSYARYSATFGLPPFVRDLLQVQHPTMRWQGIGLDLSTGDFHATGLVRQHF